jgi:hypothetical protein
MERHLLIEERPEDGEWEEQVGDRLEGLDVVDEGLSVLFFGVIQNGFLLFGLATTPPLGKRMLYNGNYKRNTEQASKFSAPNWLHYTTAIPKSSTLIY